MVGAFATLIWKETFIPGVNDVSTPIHVFPSDWLLIFHLWGRLVCSSCPADAANYGLLPFHFWGH